MAHSSFDEQMNLSPEETAAIVDNLHIHQIELEMQNEELRNTQIILQEAQIRYSTLYNFAPVGYLTIDEKGIIREANLTIVDMLKVEKRSLIRRPFSDFILPAYQDTFYKHRLDLRRSAGRVCCELQLRRSDGELFWAGLESVAAVPCSGGSGVDVGYQCAIIDVSERRRSQDALLRAHEELERRVALRTEDLRAANEALKREISEHKRTESERSALERQILQTQKMESLGVLAGGIAHDFNNLLMGILGYADLVLLSSELDPKAESYVRRMKDTAQCLSKLTNQLLAYSGKGKFIIELLDLSRIVEEMQPLLTFPISKKVTVEYNLNRELPLIEGDRNQQCQVLMNLVSNAAEAIGDKTGIISVGCGILDATRDDLACAVVDDGLPEGQYVYLQVSDTGCGLDRQNLDRVFEPFFTTKFAGRGLGLAALLGIVRSHKGAITVQSRPGIGTTFRVLYPCADRTSPIPKMERGPNVPSLQGRCTVLLVDDEEIVRDVGADYLGWLGFNVLIAQNGPDALEIFRKKQDEIDCVLLDLSMPGMSGEAAFREMRRTKDDVCVILSSGFSEYELNARYGGTGLSGFLPKPYDFKTFSQKLNMVLSTRRSMAGG